jgi:hypothetical protein
VTRRKRLSEERRRGWRGFAPKHGFISRYSDESVIFVSSNLVRVFFVEVKKIYDTSFFYFWWFSEVARTLRCKVCATACINMIGITKNFIPHRNVTPVSDSHLQSESWSQSSWLLFYWATQAHFCLIQFPFECGVSLAFIDSEVVWSMFCSKDINFTPVTVTRSKQSI